MPNQNQNTATPINKDYVPLLCTTSEFFVPHKDANHLNAQDVIYHLVSTAKDISTVTYNCFEDGRELAINSEIVANLIHELQTKLELVEKLLPMAFSHGSANHE